MPGPQQRQCAPTGMPVLALCSIKDCQTIDQTEYGEQATVLCLEHSFIMKA